MKKKLIIIFLSFVLVLSLISCAVLVAGSSSKTILKGVESCGVRLGGLSVQEASLAMRQNFANYENEKIKLVDGQDTYYITALDCSLTIDFDKTAQNAYNIGHDGNLFTRFSNTISSFGGKKYIPLVAKIDVDKTTAFLAKLTNSDIATKPSYTISGNQLVITNGISEYCVNFDKTAKLIETKFSLLDFSSITLTKEKIAASNVDIDAIYDEICGEAVDASYKIKDGNIEIIPEKTGIFFDKSKAKQTASVHNAEGETYSIDITVTPAKYTESSLRASLFRDVLAQYTTSFSESKVNRSHNVRLSASKINNTVYNTGDVFSYNDVVGERTLSNGFKEAGAYINGEVVDEVGGGICQVSSTLYNAVLYANLKVTSRTNHQLTVSYVPLGRDATVNYGTIDFKFKNDSKYPIKIITSAENGKCIVKILGTKEDNSISVELETTPATVIPFIKKETVNQSLSPNTRKVIKKGENGYTCDLYRIVKKGDTIISKKLESKSRYNATTEIVELGPVSIPSTTVKETPEPSADPTLAPTPSPTPEPIEPQDTQPAPDVTEETPQNTEDII